MAMAVRPVARAAGSREGGGALRRRGPRGWGRRARPGGGRAPRSCAGAAAGGRRAARRAAERGFAHPRSADEGTEEVRAQTGPQGIPVQQAVELAGSPPREGGPRSTLLLLWVRRRLGGRPGRGGRGGGGGGGGAGGQSRGGGGGRAT